MTLQSYLCIFQNFNYTILYNRSERVNSLKTGFLGVNISMIEHLLLVSIISSENVIKTCMKFWSFRFKITGNSWGDVSSLLILWSGSWKMTGWSLSKKALRRIKIKQNFKILLSISSVNWIYLYISSPFSLSLYLSLSLSLTLSLSPIFVFYTEMF